jgi:hypothetical protein
VNILRQHQPTTGLVLTDKDYRPIAGYPFQRWGERVGRPFSQIRPLSEGAAAAVWRRVLQLNCLGWDGALPADRYPRQERLDLRASGESWDEQTVRGWLLDRACEPGQPVLLCYGPQWVASVDWDVFCDHWLTFCWVDVCVCPASEQWVLRHDSEVFVFGQRA